MKNIKKISALVLALILVLSLAATAFAAVEIGSGQDTAATYGAQGDGEIGGFISPDSPIVMPDKVVRLKKEITVYNLDENTVYAPTITYSYAIAPGPAGTSVTDATSDHASGIGAITAPTIAGVGNPTITASVSWTTADTLSAGTDGVANEKSIDVDFSNVVFTGAGIYRYMITETPPASYAATGVTEGNQNHVRFLDVYVKPSAAFEPTNGTTKTAYVAADWDIYGYVCVDDSTTGTTAITTSTTKTNGFVDSDDSATGASNADKYYTYNLTISKTVENDAYAAATHQFPFTVIFTNNDITQNILLDTTETGTVTDFNHAAGAPTWSGIAGLKSGGSIKYIGIPMGTDVEVYETNDVAGATYRVTTTRTNATTATATENAVISGNRPNNATTQAGSGEPFVKTNAYESTKSIINTTKDGDDDLVHTIAITNTLVNISPTGVTLRVAPYVLMLAVGIFFVAFTRRRREEAEAA